MHAKTILPIFIKKIICFLPFIFLLSSCCSPTVCHYRVLDAETFVQESQIIADVGSNAIKQMQGYTIIPIPEDALEEYRDTIAEDDILNIVIYHPTRIDLVNSIHTINDRTKGFRVTNGQIYLPSVGDVSVIHLTLQEARDTIKNRFTEEIKDVDVFVSYRDRLSHRVELAGMVAISHYPIDGKSRLYEILAASRLPPVANLFTSYVLRGNQQLDVNLYKLLNQGDMSQNIVMKPGDKIFIGSPSDRSVLVMGEIPVQRPVPVIHGFLPLKEALAAVGGLSFRADKKCIQIIRGSLERPQIYVVSWDFMIHHRNEDLLLIPGDLVYISETPITQWERLITQLQVIPLLTAVSLSQNIYHQTR